MIYLACAYSKVEPKSELLSVLRKVCALGIMDGYDLLSPILHWHDAAIEHSLPTDINFWRSLNKNWIERSDQLWVLDHDDWENSDGVRYELSVAEKANKRRFIVRLTRFGLVRTGLL